MFGRTVCNCMVTFLLESRWESVLLRSRLDPAEGGVVIGRVITGLGSGRWLATADDAARSAVASARRGHGVLAVVAARPAGQGPLAIAEHHAVFRIQERTARMDRLVHRLRRCRQFGDGDRLAVRY